MTLSVVMVITPKGILVYLGHKGEMYEVIGGRDGQIHLRKL